MAEKKNAGIGEVDINIYAVCRKILREENIIKSLKTAVIVSQMEKINR